MNFKEQKTNIEILIKNSFSSDLPDNLCLIYIDTDKVIKLFEDISNGLYNTIYGIDQVTGLITTVNRKDQNTPNYIYNDGVEPVQYFGYKNNKRYRELSIPHFNFYIAFVYNTIIVKDVLFKNIYSENNDGKKDYSNSPILVKNFKEELVFTSTVNYKDEIVEEVESMMLEDTEFIGEAERTRMFNNAVLKDIKAEGISLHYLETDIESYFENIYTHSLNELKTLSPYKNIKDKGVEKYFEFLDYFNMKTNLNHTKGILTGPLSSAISAELLLISIDEFIHEKIKDKDISYKRYVDDMWFYSNDVTALNKTINSLQEILTEFHLSIQHEKTHIEKKIRNRKTGSINEVYNVFPFLTKENYKINAADLLYISSLTSKIDESVDYSFWKTFFTILYKKIESNDILIPAELVDVLVTMFLKLGFLNTPLQVRIYRVINSIIEYYINNDFINSIIQNVLKSTSEYVNSELSNTIGQIWHYYLICKIYNKEINPLVLVSFVEEDNEEINEIIFKYISNIYSVKNNGFEETIAYSKWWLPLLQLRTVGTYQENSFNKLFTTENKNKPMREQLFMPFSIIKFEKTLAESQSGKVNPFDLSPFLNI